MTIHKPDPAIEKWISYKANVEAYMQPGFGFLFKLAFGGIIAPMGLYAYLVVKKAEEDEAYGRTHHKQLWEDHILRLFVNKPSN
jgi:hypothetical protein